MSEEMITTKKKRNLSEEDRERRREHMRAVIKKRIELCGGGRPKMQPRIRVMCDKAMYEEVVKIHGNIDNAMRVMLGK